MIPMLCYIPHYCVVYLTFHHPKYISEKDFVFIWKRLMRLMMSHSTYQEEAESVLLMIQITLSMRLTWKVNSWTSTSSFTLFLSTLINFSVRPKVGKPRSIKEQEIQDVCRENARIWLWRYFELTTTFIQFLINYLKVDQRKPIIILPSPRRQHSSWSLRQLNSL